MKDPQFDLVREFHKKFDFACQTLVTEILMNEADAPLKMLAEQLIDVSKKMLPAALQAQELGDERAYRAHLMLEELGEVCLAMSRKDENKLADGLADLMYVTVGSGVTYDLPVTLLFNEAHRSNMTKSRDKKNNPRMSSSTQPKTFQPPDFQRVIAEWRDHRDGDEQAE